MTDGATSSSIATEVARPAGSRPGSLAQWPPRIDTSSKATTAAPTGYHAKRSSTGSGSSMLTVTVPGASTTAAASSNVGAFTLPSPTNRLDLSHVAPFRSSTPPLDLPRPKSAASRRIQQFLRDAVQAGMAQPATGSQIARVAFPGAGGGRNNRRSMEMSDATVASFTVAGFTSPVSAVSASNASLQRKSSYPGGMMSPAGGGINSPSNASVASGGTAQAHSRTPSSSLTQAQQAANTMTLDELLSEAWKMHARRASFLRPSIGAGGAPSTNLAEQIEQVDPQVRAQRAKNMTCFLAELWKAIMKDKQAAGVNSTEQHQQHSFARFERLFRRAHDTGPDAHTSRKTVLDLSSCGLGPKSGSIVARFVRDQEHYTELRLARNELGDEGTKPLWKLLRKFKPLQGVVTAVVPVGAFKDDEALLSSRRSRRQNNTGKGRGNGKGGRSKAFSLSPARRSGTETTHAATQALTSRSGVPSHEQVLASLRRQVSMVGSGPGANGANGMATLSSAGPLVRKLDCSYNGLTSQAFVDLADVLPHSTVRTLDLGSDHQEDKANRMGERGAAALATALASLTCPVQHLHLAGVGSTGWTTLVRQGLLAAAPYSQLQTLNVRGNWLPNDAFNLLMKACRAGLHQLTHLTLAKNRMSSHGCSLLFDYLRSTTVLKYLDLSMCCLTSTGIGSLGNSGGIALPPPQQGGSPSAPAPGSAHDIGSSPKDFFAQLFEAQARNTNFCSLEELILDENHVGDAGAKQIGLALALLNSHLPNLKALSLVNCNMQDIQWFAYGLSRNTTLTKLNLSTNPLGDGGSIALALALQGRLELDSTLQPILTLRQPFESEEEELAAKEEQERQAAAERQHTEATNEEDEVKHKLQDAIHDPNSAAAAAVAANGASKDGVNTIAEPNLDLLSLDYGLRKTTTNIPDARNLKAIPKGGRIIGIKRDVGPNFPRVQEQERPKNIFYDLSIQQLNAARFANSKRVIIYSKKSSPVCQLLHLNLTHTGMGDVGCLHFTQVVQMNWALKELLLQDNDLTQSSGIALLNTLKSIQPQDNIKLIGLTLKQNRINDELVQKIQNITRARKQSDHVMRLKNYQLELRTFRSLQRSKFSEFIVAIQTEMKEDELLRKELLRAQDSFQRAKQQEVDETTALLAELEQLKQDHAAMQYQFPQYDELLSRRITSLQIEHAKREDHLTTSLRAELKQSDKLRHDRDAIRDAIEQEKAEGLLDQRPFLSTLEQLHKSISLQKQTLVAVKQEKNLFEREIIRTYFAILRNCGKGVTKLLNPDSSEYTLSNQQSSESAKEAAAVAAVEAAEELRKKRAVFFGGDVFEKKETATPTVVPQQQSEAKRPPSPRLTSALRFLALFPNQAAREKVQLKLIDHARTQGRNVEKLPAFKLTDLDRMSPRTRSAIQKLRGDAETEWEIRLKHEALALAQKRALEAEESKRTGRRKSRGMSVSASAAAAAGGISGAQGSALATVEEPVPGSSDGSIITLSIEIVTSLLQLSPLTKVQGSTTVYAMIMHGLNHGAPIYVTLNASPEADQMQQAWEEKYGVYKPGLGKRIRKQPNTDGLLQPGATMLLPSPSPPPLTFTCASNATSSVLIKLISEKLGVTIHQINSLSYQEKRPDDNKQVTAAGAPADLVTLIRAKELKELQAKKKQQAEAKKSAAGGSGPDRAMKEKRSKKKKSAKAPATPTKPSSATEPSRSSPAIPVPVVTIDAPSSITSATEATVAPAIDDATAYDPATYAASTSHHHATAEDEHPSVVASVTIQPRPSDSDVPAHAVVTAPATGESSPTPPPAASVDVAPSSLSQPPAPTVTSSATAMPKKVNLMPFGAGEKKHRK